MDTEDQEKLEIVAKEEGHKLDVNCVMFNPVFKNIFASCSDDRTIKIWGVN